MFEELSSILKVNDEGHLFLDLEKELILQHLEALESGFIKYFPGIDDNELDLIQNLFILPVEKVSDSLQDEFLEPELKADSCARDLFNKKLITEFRPLMCDSYPIVAKKAVQGVLSFVSSFRIWLLNSLANKNKTKKQIGCGKCCALCTF